ncbi:MAG: M15 family metallopeptidase [Bryobacteraceae bacterium]
MSASCLQMKLAVTSSFSLILIGVMSSSSPLRSKLVDLHRVDASLLIDARYAKPDNFVGVALYPANQLFLLDLVAEDLVAAQAEFTKLGLGLKIWDGYRPLSVQKRMWAIVHDERFVANPEPGSNHNRGCAVDVTLVGKNGEELRMPTGFDDFSDKAHRDYQDLPRDVLHNRGVLAEVMQQHHFVPFATEWWHFDHQRCKEFPVLDLNPFGASKSSSR